MKKKTLVIVYGISMILLIPLTIDLFINTRHYGSGLIILFLIVFATKGMVKMRKGVDK